MKQFLTFSLCGCLLIACNLQDKTQTETTKSKFQAFKLQDAEGKVGPELDSNGNFLLHGDTLGKLTEAGEIMGKDQKQIALFKNDTLYFNNNEKTKHRIDKAGTIYEADSVAFSWDKNGNLLKGSEHTGLKVVPNNPTVYTNASILFLLYFTIGDVFGRNDY